MSLKSIEETNGPVFSLGIILTQIQGIPGVCIFLEEKLLDAQHRKNVYFNSGHDLIWHIEKKSVRNGISWVVDLAGKGKPQCGALRNGQVSLLRCEEEPGWPVCMAHVAVLRALLWLSCG